jgi:hypothetical protein
MDREQADCEAVILFIAREWGMGMVLAYASSPLRNEDGLQVKQAALVYLPLLIVRRR